MPVSLAVGDPAPSFELPIAGGGRLTSTSLKGAPFVLYFYPKDDTPGCTREAVDFTTRAPAFAALGAPVVGVSKDSVQKHVDFKAKHTLSLLLASDADNDTCERFGVWVEKRLYGRTYMGIERATFLIDDEGMIAALWRKVKVPGHVDAVLDATRRLLSMTS